MKEKIEKLKNLANDHKAITIIIIILFFLFVVPPFINLIVTTNWGIGFINSENESAWIGFYGAIIGGGVAWTIYDQDKKRKKDLAVQYRPILIVENYTKHIINSFAFKYTLTIKNTGRGEAKNIRISIPKDNMLIFEIYKNRCIYHEMHFTDILPQNTCESTTLAIILDDKYKQPLISIDFIIKYTDIYNNNITSTMLLLLDVSQNNKNNYNDFVMDFNYNNPLNNKN